ncbi:AsmA family protein, partial [Alphaproteobacteria bacterium]|nr:AsmA family protein [Alphaproteobacteria bacterium]
MNKLAVGFATFLLVGLITLFAVPLLVNWQKYETSISHFVTQRIGLKTEIAGEIELKIFPHPTFVFENVVFKDPASGKVISNTPKIEGRPRLWSLLKGELSLEHVKLTGSNIDLTGQNTSVEQHLLNWIQDAESRPEKSSVRWNRLELEDCRLVWAPFNQASRRVDGIQLVSNEADGSSKREMSADFSINGIEHNFELTVGAAITSGSNRSLVSRQLDLELVDKLNDQAIDFSGAVLLDRLNSVVLDSLVLEGTASGKGVLGLLGLHDLYPELSSLSNAVAYSTDLRIDRAGASFRNIKLNQESADFNGEAYLSYGGRPVIEASFQSDRFEPVKGGDTQNVNLLKGWLVDIKALLARNYWTDVRLNLTVDKMVLGGIQLGRVNASLNYLDGLVLDSELT